MRTIDAELARPDIQFLLQRGTMSDALALVVDGRALLHVFKRAHREKGTGHWLVTPEEVRVRMAGEGWLVGQSHASVSAGGACQGAGGEAAAGGTLLPLGGGLPRQPLSEGVHRAYIRPLCCGAERQPLLHPPALAP